MKKNLLKIIPSIFLILVIIYSVSIPVNVSAIECGAFQYQNEAGDGCIDIPRNTPNDAPSSLSNTSTTSTSIPNSTPVTSLGSLMVKIRDMLESIIPVIVALGMVYFVWGVVQFVIADSEEAKGKGKDRIIYGLIGFAIIAGLWGLVNIVVRTFGFSNSAPSVSSLVVQNPATCSLMGSPTFQDVLCYVTKIINDSVIPLIFAIATAMFVWGVVQFFILNSDEEAKRAQGKQFMIWGIVALAVMLCVWGLVGILGNTLNLKGGILPQVTPPK
jgi:hypothetical protein